MRSPANYWLDDLMGRYGVSPSELAERIGVSRQRVYRASLYPPTIEFLARVCRALGADLRDETCRLIDAGYWTGDETK